MSVSTLLELKTSDKIKGIKGKILFLCSLCLTIAAMDHFFCDFFQEKDLILKIDHFSVF